MNRTAIGRFTVVLTLLALLLGLASQLAVAQDTIRLGAAISMTGTFAREGSLVKAGYDFWRDWVNQQGGINVGGKKYKVDIVYYDDKSDTMTAAKLTERLITEDKVNFLLAPYSSAITFATSAIGERYGYITLAGAANSDSLYERGYKNLFSVFPRASLNFTYTAQVLANQKQPPKTVAILSLDSLFTLLAADGLRKSLSNYGLQESYYTKFPPKTTDFAAMLTIIKAKNPDVIFFSGYFEDAVPFLKQAKELNVNPKAFAFLDAPQLDDWSKVLGKDGDDVFGVFYWSSTMKWKGPYFDAKSFADAFQKKYGTVPLHLNAVGATCGLLLQIAIEKAGTLDQNKVRETLRNLDLTTFYSPFKWDDKGNNIKARLGSFQVQNGKMVVIDPPEPGAKVIYPLPGWNQR